MPRTWRWWDENRQHTQHQKARLSAAAAAGYFAPHNHLRPWFERRRFAHTRRRQRCQAGNGARHQPTFPHSGSLQPVRSNGMTYGRLPIQRTQPAPQCLVCTTPTRCGTPALHTKGPRCIGRPDGKDDCDCLNACGDDPWIESGRSMPCEHRRETQARIAALTTAAPAAVVGPSVTDAMALAFHSALSDGAIGSDEVEETKAGLRAALAAAPTTQPAPQQEAQEPVAWYFKSPARPGEQPLIKKLDWRPHNRNWRPLVELAAVERATAPQPSPAAQGNALDAEQHEMDAKHAAIYRWMLGHVADVLSIFDNWLADEEADTDELHDALAARAAQEGK